MRQLSRVRLRFDNVAYCFVVYVVVVWSTMNAEGTSHCLKTLHFSLVFLFVSLYTSLLLGRTCNVGESTGENTEI